MMYEACAAQLLELLIYGAHAGQRARQAMQMLQGEIVVLYLLYCLGGSVTPGYISRQLNRSASRITNTLNALEEKHFVRRDHESDDRRKVTVHLTQTGRAYMEQEQRQLILALARALTCLNEGEVREYLRLNQKLSRSFHGAFPCPLGSPDAKPLASTKGSA